MSDLKKQIRPALPALLRKENMSVDELFQNSVLRPIIKLQNDLIISHFEHYLRRKRVIWQDFSVTQKKVFLQKAFNRDAQLKVGLRSLIIGLFTLEEFKQYLKNESQLNRRINIIIEKRVTDYFI
jgi:hypothetical protein